MIQFLAQWALFVLLNILVAGIAVSLASWKLQPDTKLLDTLLDWVAVCLGIVIVVPTALGVLGALSLSSIVLVLSAIAVFIVWAAWKQGHLRQLRAHLVRWLSALVAPADQDRIWLVAFLFLWGAVALSSAALVEPSNTVDSLTYHLSMPVNWVQHRRLSLHYLPWSDQSNTYFPGNGELLYLWALFPFRDDLLVRMVSVFIWVVLGLSLYSIIQRVTRSRRIGVLAANLFMFTPLVQSQATDLSLDMASAAMFTLALGYLVRLRQRWRLRTLLLCGLSSGVFLGLKYSGPAYLMLLLLGLLSVLFLPQAGGPVRLRKRLFYLGLWCLIVVVFGGYWYLRNLRLTGSPIYPLSVELGPLRLFAGCYSVTGYESKTLIGQIGKMRLSALVRALVAGYGGAYWMIVALSLGALIVGVWRSRADDRGRSVAINEARRVLIPISLLTIVSLFLYMQTPYSVMRFTQDQSPATATEMMAGMRFSLIGGALLMLGASIGVGIFGELPEMTMILAGLNVIGFVQAVLSGYDGIRLGFYGSRVFSLPVLLAASVLAIVALYGIRRLMCRDSVCAIIDWAARLQPKDVALRLSLSLVLLSLLTGGSLYLLSRYRQSADLAVLADQYGALGQGWQWVNQEIANSRIALVGFPTFYPLYGSRWVNEVRYINIDGDLNDMYHDFCERSEYYRSDGGSYEIWKRNLDLWGADYVVFSRVIPLEIAEGKWISENPDSFVLLFENAELSVYQVDR